MKKIGLLLGSFDPIHVAHLNIAACALNSKLVDKVLFVVAKHNPWKKEPPVDFELRCKMIEASIEPFGDKCEVCRLEDGIEPPTYSYKVLDLIRQMYGEYQLNILCGTDTYNKIPGWKNYKESIEPYFKYIVVGRYLDPGHNFPDAGKSFRILPFGKKENMMHEIIPLTMTISSTVVRNMIKEGMNPVPLVTNETYKIIRDNNLYKNG